MRGWMGGWMDGRMDGWGGAQLDTMHETEAEGKMEININK